MKMQVSGEDNEGGFLKLKSTKEWLSGDATAPINKKRTLKVFVNKFLVLFFLMVFSMS